MTVSNLGMPVNMATVGYEAAPDASDLGVSFGHIAALDISAPSVGLGS